MKHTCILISTLPYTVHDIQHTILVPGTQHTQYNTSPWYTALTHNTIPVHGTKHPIQYWYLHGTQLTHNTILVPAWYTINTKQYRSMVHNKQYNTGTWYTINTHNTIPAHGTQHTIPYWFMVQYWCMISNTSSHICTFVQY